MKNRKRIITENLLSIDGFIYELGEYHPEIDEFSNILKDFIIKSGCQGIELRPLSSKIGGLSLHDRVVINENILNYRLGYVLYVIFHEIAHQYQYKKYGKDFVYNLYLNKISVDEALGILKHIELTADEFAIRKCRELVKLGHLDDKVVMKKGFYKSLPNIEYKILIIKTRNLMRSKKITDTERISEIYYNYIINLDTNQPQDGDVSVA